MPLAAAIWSSIVVCALSAPDDRFFGGPYDGYAFSTFEQFTPSYSPRFAGGAYDGYALDDFSQYERSSDLALHGPRFAGGAHDGYDRVDFTQYDASSSPHGIGPRFAGGAYDGYDMVALFQYAEGTSPQDNSPRFVGGAYDGSDADHIFALANPLDRDSDLDGLPDWWELPFFGGVTNASPLGDQDGDHVSETDEFIADTDPSNSNSYFGVVAWTSDAVYVVTFPSSTNRFYTLQCSPAVSGRWQIVAGQVHVPGSGSAMTLEHTNATPLAYYRVWVEKP